MIRLRSRSRRPARRDPMPGPSLADATSIYVAGGRRAATGMYTKGDHLDILGISTSLDRAITEHERFRLNWLLRYVWDISGQVSRTGERVGEDWPIFQIPLDTMIRARRAPKVYGRQRPLNGVNGWGPIEALPSAAEVEAVKERERYRVANRDKPDPYVKVARKASAALAAPIKASEDVFVVSSTGEDSRSALIGFFRTYPAALQAATDKRTRWSVIRSIPLDGKTGLAGGQQLRGQFPNGWGYASGYSPSSFGIR